MRETEVGEHVMEIYVVLGPLATTPHEPASEGSIDQGVRGRGQGLGGAASSEGYGASRWIAGMLLRHIRLWLQIITERKSMA